MEWSELKFKYGSIYSSSYRKYEIDIKYFQEMNSAMCQISLNGEILVIIPFKTIDEAKQQSTIIIDKLINA